MIRILKNTDKGVGKNSKESKSDEKILFEMRAAMNSSMDQMKTTK